MLELAQVMTEIGAMGREAHKRGDRVASQLRAALRQARLEGDAWTEARACIGRAQKHNWLAAQCGAESPASVSSLPELPAPPVYSALAVDGSQIPLDRHAIAPCFLLNVGEIALHYGTGERPRLTSQATLHYKEEEIYQRAGGGDPVPLTEKIIANRRFLAESAALAALIAENHARTAIALIDGPLILWTPPGEPEVEQRKIIEPFCEMLQAGQAAGTPVAGYISRPRARDVVGALRLTLCRENCAHGPDDPCAAWNHLTDAQLYAPMLHRTGDRSPLFGSAAHSLAHYPEGQKIIFFYVNVGLEIARIEIPQWVADSPALRTQAQALCCDQASKGQGYPVALSEAHERAIVRGPEREAFFRLVEAAFVRENVPALQTRKAFAKRTRVL